MTTPDVTTLASALALAVRRGDELSTVAGDDAIEALREAAGYLREVNRRPEADVDLDLLLGEDELFVIDRQFRRADALAALYEAEQRREGPDLGDLSEAAAALAAGVWGTRSELDAAIGDVATGWRVERMPPIDRTILRIGLWELQHRPETPTAVVIAEAVRLAKLYSTERSGGFINGVLARLSEDRGPAAAESS